MRPAGATGNGVERPIESVVLVVELNSCTEWARQLVEFFEREDLPEFWRPYPLRYVDARSVDGRVYKRRFRARGSVLLVFGEGEELIAAKSLPCNVARLGRWLEALSSGVGTVSDLRARLLRDPSDTEALWRLGKMQGVCEILGSKADTYEIIREEDADRRTPGGEAVFHEAEIERFFLNSVGKEPADLDFSGLTSLAEKSRAPSVRCTMYLSIAKFAEKLERDAEQREYLLSGWKACPESWRPEIALQIRRAAAWPQGALSEREPWPSIAAVAEAARSKFIGATDARAPAEEGRR